MERLDTAQICGSPEEDVRNLIKNCYNCLHFIGIQSAILLTAYEKCLPTYEKRLPYKYV